MTRPRIALCHEWLTTWGGSEQVAGRIASALEISDIFTFALEDRTAKRVFGDLPVRASSIGGTSFATKHWKWLLPFMARWWQGLDLSPFDAVVTSSHAAVNSVRARPGALHVSYCSTPMRYAWEWRAELKRVPRPMRPMWPLFAAYLRRADRERATHVDLFIANSRHVQRRIHRHYGRPSIVIHPPVNTAYFTPVPDAQVDDYFLSAGRLVAYKGVDIAVRAATVANVRLVVAGSGPELSRLKRLAGPTVEFVVDPSDSELRDLYRRARAFIHPGVEDFGMTMVEAQGCGTPVIAVAHGGAREAVQDGLTGVLYGDQTVEALTHTLSIFDRDRFDPLAVRKHAELFSAERFEAAIQAVMAPLTTADPGERPAVLEHLLSTVQ